MPWHLLTMHILKNQLYVLVVLSFVILIKAFSDDDIKELQSSGEIVVAGHTLTMEDIKLLYTVDPARSSVYEAHSDGKVCEYIGI